MQCTNCHFENMPGVDACGRCGAILAAWAPRRSTSIRPAPAAGRNPGGGLCSGSTAYTTSAGLTHRFCRCGPGALAGQIPGGLRPALMVRMWCPAGHIATWAESGGMDLPGGSWAVASVGAGVHWHLRRAVSLLGLRVACPCRFYSRHSAERRRRCIAPETRFSARRGCLLAVCGLYLPAGACSARVAMPQRFSSIRRRSPRATLFYSPGPIAIPSLDRRRRSLRPPP